MSVMKEREKQFKPDHNPQIAYFGPNRTLKLDELQNRTLKSDEIKSKN